MAKVHVMNAKEIFDDDGTGVIKKHKKILILGSGLTAPRVHDLKLDDWTVLAINNAYMLNKFDWLIYPNDFTNIPKANQVNGKKVINFNEYSQVDYKYGGQAKRGNTMMFNAAYYALAQKPDVIAFLGCDMDYPTSGNTHFYGTGTPDPLRLGNESLIELIERFATIAKEEGVKVYNMSPLSCQGLLSYPRAGLIDSKKALFLAFNDKYVDYARVLIKSFWRYHSKETWTVNCFCTNVKPKSINDSVFKDDSIIIHSEDYNFLNQEEERCYMNSTRFVRYAKHTSDYDFCYMTDADAIFLKNIDSLNFDMFAKDIAICKNDTTQDTKRMVSACSLACKNTNGARIFFSEYEKLINEHRNRDNVQWFNDQLVLLELLKNTNIEYHNLNKLEYAWYQDSPITKVLVTSTDNKFGNIIYKKHYESITSA